MKLTVYPSAIETSRAVILHLIKLMSKEPEKVFHIALSGGSTPSLMFELWANEYADATSWRRIRFYWVDERCVPPEHSDSNYGVANRIFLKHVPVACTDVFRIHGEDEPVKEALRYSKIVEKNVMSRNSWPEFDVVLLGIGEDGHTSSIFPGQEELLASKQIYAVSRNPGSGQERIALTGLPILNARHIIFLVTGKNKAEIVKKVYQQSSTGPAAYIAHHSENVEFFIDEDSRFD